MKKIFGMMIIALMITLTGCDSLIDTSDQSVQTDNSTTNSNNTTTTTTTTTTPDGNVTDVNTTTVDAKEGMPEVPAFAGNSQGKLVVNCGEDIRFLVAYNCLKTNTSVRGTASNGTLTEVDSYKVGNTYVKEYIVTDRKPNTVITGYFSAGTVVDGPLGTQTCK